MTARRILVLLAATVAAAGGAGVARPAGAATGVGATGAACPDSSGVTVVVDATALGGSISVGCAPGPVRDGLDALARAGFQVTQPLRTPGFVCRIDGRPSVNAEPCVDTPPPTAYWSYWTEAGGGEWAYSSLGAASRSPKPGSVEGWSFSLGASAQDAPPPGIAPPAPPAAPTPTTAPRAATTPPSASPRPAVAAATTTRPTAPTPTVVGVGPGGAPEPSTTAPTVAPDSTTSSAPEATSTSPGPAVVERAADRSTGAAESPARGSALPTVLTLVAVLAVAGGGVTLSRRRRGEAPPT